MYKRRRVERAVVASESAISVGLLRGTDTSNSSVVMAVQAQRPSNAFAPDFRGRDEDSLPGANALLEAYANLGEQQMILINAARISDPESELTCNAPGSRKRYRDDDEVMVLPHPGHRDNQISHWLQSRLQGTSTSGRPPAISPVAQDLVSHLYRQSLEIDALIRVQSEKIRSGLEEARKRHCQSLISILEKRAEKRLEQIEAELESVRRKNAEMEEKARQIEEESQMWFNVAKNNEAIAASLRATLEQALLRNAAAGGGGRRAKEGYGDSDGDPFPADDAQSCCFEEAAGAEADRGIVGGGREALRWRRACKACGVREVAFLLLPCRHLCVCEFCDSMIDTCPICRSSKHASFQIFMS